MYNQQKVIASAFHLHIVTYNDYQILRYCNYQIVICNPFNIVIYNNDQCSADEIQML